MASAVSSNKGAAMTASPPAVELRSRAPPADPATNPIPLASSSRDPTVNPARRSRILSSSDSASKRLSTASNPSREAPKPTQPSNISSPPTAYPMPTTVATTSPKTSTPASLRNKVPSFPPPQQSRVSMISIASNRDSWHPQFTSSLSYASVRDFAYPAIHPLHYGPTVTLNSGLTTPGDLQEAVGGAGSWFTGAGSGFRRLSDPAVSSGDGLLWGDAAQFRQRQSNQPPPLNFEDGPPWSEDDDLQSPIVVLKQGNNHRKHKSSMAHLASQHNRHLSKNVFTPTTLQHFPGSRGDWDAHRRSTSGNGLLGLSGDSYYTTSAGRQDLDDGEPGGELYHHAESDEYDPAGAGYYDPDSVDSDDEEGGQFNSDETDFYNSRFSKDYQFTIASPAEEMHGKAVALFDFIQENENELPLVEGQVVWVSYRHGMGWLVAEDPKTGESGLVPEEYVCLIRDMHAGGATDLLGHDPNASATDAHVSTFSTSSQDVLPYAYPDEVEKIRREQERAIEEVTARGVTPRLRSDAFEAEVRVNGKDAKEYEN